MASDATNKVPTLDEQMGALKGFSTQDGEVATTTAKAAEPEAKEPAKPLTAAERLAAFNKAEGKPATKAVKEQADEDAETDEDAASDTADAGEDEGENDDKQERPTRRDRRNDPQVRINEAIKRQRIAERERDAERARTSALEARLARLEAGLTPPAARGNNAATTDQDTPPDPADYQYGELDTKFIADTARYETLKTLREQETRRASAYRQSQEAESREIMAQKFREFEVTGLARYDDFDEVVSESAKRGEWALSPFLASLLIDSEHGTDIAYHLATHRDEAKRVFAMTPAGQAKWFGQREAVLSSEAPDPRYVAARVSQAPGVPRREARGSGSRQQVSPDTADFAAFERLANAGSR